MTPLSSWALIGYAIGLKVALVIVLVSRYRWRKVAMAQASEMVADGGRWATTLTAAQHVIDDRTARALELVSENVRLRNALANVVGIIGRRPPRRRWLALARRIAQLAA